MVQEISGQNDFGEDLYVTFVKDEHVTSDVIRIQVKGGDKWRRANGYAVPVSHHGDTWADGNIPVYCVVYDPDNKRLFDTTMESFVAQARRYVGRYRGRQAVLTHLGEMSGVEFDPADHVLHFVNGYDEGRSRAGSIPTGGALPDPPHLHRRSIAPHRRTGSNHLAHPAP
ncbi:DUF4365 domain-containing protein [Kitasatospora griseola]|uniref:DUF4365 domain-containing protein n=1 Tax=Kitasatospora griseola TaxID=2064 RepID=UPI0038121F03